MIGARCGAVNPSGMTTRPPPGSRPRAMMAVSISTFAVNQAQGLLPLGATVGRWREAVALLVADILDFQVARLVNRGAPIVQGIWRRDHHWCLCDHVRSH